MPYDPHGTEDDDALEPGEKAGRRRVYKDFDCPSCSANNPYDDGFGDGDEVTCYYCGAEFKASVNDEGRLRLREL
jgi:transcription elongation factor Elf1